MNCVGLQSSPKQSDGGNGRPRSVAAKFLAAAPTTLTEKWVIKRDNICFMH